MHITASKPVQTRVGPAAASGSTPSIRVRPLWWFFGLAYAVSWAFWFPAVAASFHWISPIPSRYLHLAGGLGPMLAAMIVTSLTEGQSGLTRLAKLGSILLTWLFNSSGGSIAVVALFHAALDVFISSPVAALLPNLMGAMLTVGTLLLIPVVGRRDLSRRPRVIESGVPGGAAVFDRFRRG